MYAPPVHRAPIIRLPTQPSKRPAPPVEPSGRVRKQLPWDSVVITLVSLLVLGGIAYFGLSWAYSPYTTAVPTTTPNEAAQAVQRPVLYIDRVLNVSQPNVQSSSLKMHIRVSMAIQFADPSGAFAKAKDLDLGYLERNFAADHSAALDVFNDILTTTVDTKTPTELWSPEGKEALRQELMTKFNQALAGTGDQVVYINFTDFVLQ